MTDVAAKVLTLIERCEWDNLLSALEEETITLRHDEAWSLLLHAFCKAVIAGDLPSTVNATRTTHDDDDALSKRSTVPSSASSLTSKLNIRRQRPPPLPSSIVSIISLLVRLSPEFCDGIFVSNEGYNYKSKGDGNTILHSVVSLLLDAIKSQGSVGVGGRRERASKNRKNENQIHSSLDICLVIIHTLTGLRPNLLSMTNERDQTPVHCLLSLATTIDVDEERIGEKLHLLMKALMGKKLRDDNDDDCVSESRKVLSIRDWRGRLPLHCAAACPWVDGRMLRTLVETYPEACRLPVDPLSSLSKNQQHLEYYRGKDLAVHILHRRMIMEPVVLISQGAEVNMNLDDTEHVKNGSRGDGIRGSRHRRRFGGGEPSSIFHDNDNDEDNEEKNVAGGGSDCCSDVDKSIELSSSSSSESNGQHRQLRHNSDENDRSGSSSNNGWGENHCSSLSHDAISALLGPIVTAANDDDDEAAKFACASTGSSCVAPADTGDARDGDDSIHSTMSSLQNSYYNSMSGESCIGTVSTVTTILLPLHIAALHGVSHEVLEGLCCAYPEGVATPMIIPSSRKKFYSIELFEEGRAGFEVRNAADDEDFASLSKDYFRRSDLLFSYFPEAAFSSSSRAVYYREEARLARFEDLIRSEALDPPNSNGLLSDIAGSVWLFICRSTTGNDTAVKSRKNTIVLPNFDALVGRILYGLDTYSVQRLHYVRTTSMPEGVLVPPLGNGRTVLEEARERSTIGNMVNLLKVNFFHSCVLSYLNARDALSYSATCRRAWTCGVRLLQNDDGSSKNRITTMDSNGSWELSEECRRSAALPQQEGWEDKLSLPWQKIDLPFIANCTHTVFISCNITYQSWHEESTCEGGGLLVVGEDAMMNGRSKLIVASDPVKAGASRDGNDSLNKSRSFSFNHSPGRSYTLWYYGSQGHTLTVSNLAVHQLVYACDYNGHNPLHVFLSEELNPSNTDDQLRSLVAAGFGSDLPIHYALKVGV